MIDYLLHLKMRTHGMEIILERSGGSNKLPGIPRLAPSWNKPVAKFDVPVSGFAPWDFQSQGPVYSGAAQPADA